MIHFSKTNGVTPRCGAALNEGDEVRDAWAADFMKRHSDFMRALAVVQPLPKPYPSEADLRYELDNGGYIKARLKVEEGDLILSLVEMAISVAGAT